MAACGGVAKRETPSEAPKRGAYYKDDGPGDQPPPNLASVPDAQPRIEPLHRFANRPYQVFGRDYVPLTDARNFRQRGVASWYGKRFHGKPTSSGEPYDMYAMTAAHPTLPIPSYARVTHRASGRSVVVRVNDRGPFHKGRIMDLSYAAAHRLGYANVGSAEVEVEAIIPDGVELVATATPVPPLPG
ncbi:MAG TPA: septal ring lytic transglycosylase RlpA family protein, partial [Burkholderiales bacterium]|nr:septal ring lytic transglycosylase RlpA family protein [Burkholderiales bacterium]